MVSFLATTSRWIDAVNDAVGRAVSWLAIVMVLVQFVVVLMRHIFGLGSIMLQESVVYMYAVLFMVGAAYTLLRDGHVRVDILYRGASRRRQALVNLCGVPPFGFALFYLRGVAPETVTTGQIYRGVAPFVVIQLFALVLLAQFPAIATWLPKVIFGSFR